MTDGLASSLDLNSLETICLDFAELSDMYRYWRMNSLRVRGWVNSNITGSAMQNFAMYFQPNGSTNAISIGDLEGKFSVGLMASQNSKGESCELVLGREELHTITPWFVTLNDTNAGADTDGPGNIVLTTISTTTADGDWLADVHMSVTFRSRLDPSSISSLMRKRVEEELLGSKGGKTDPPKREMVQALTTKVPGVTRRQ